MTDTIVLNLPDEISSRVRRIAEETAQPVEQVLLEHIKSLSAPAPVLPSDVQAELDALVALSDDALWTIAREQMPTADQGRAGELLNRQAQAELSPEEQRELDLLVERADRLALRKAEAAALLRTRGRDFNQGAFSKPNG